MATRLVRPTGIDNGPICAALANFGKQLAGQVVRYGIRVNTIHPDFTNTQLLMAFFTREASSRGISLEEIKDEKAKGMPIERLIEPEEIAGLAAFLSYLFTN